MPSYELQWLLKLLEKNHPVHTLYINLWQSHSWTLREMEEKKGPFWCETFSVGNELDGRHWGQAALLVRWNWFLNWEDGDANINYAEYFLLPVSGRRWKTWGVGLTLDEKEKRCLPYPPPNTSPMATSAVPVPQLPGLWMPSSHSVSGPRTHLDQGDLNLSGRDLSVSSPLAPGCARAGFSSFPPPRSHPGCNRPLHSHKSPPYPFQGNINFHWKFASPFRFCILPSCLDKISFPWLSVLPLAPASSRCTRWQARGRSSPAGCHET